MTTSYILEHAAACAHLLGNTSDPKQRLLLEGLRELWNALATESWRFTDADLAEEVETLCDAQARIVAGIRPTLH